MVKLLKGTLGGQAEALWAACLGPLRLCWDMAMEATRP